MRKVALYILVCCATSLLARSGAALGIRHVSTERARTTNPMVTPVAVRFELSEAASVELRIYDTRDLLVRRVQGQGVLSAGQNEIAWDGRDLAGRPVPDGAYHYLLAARAPGSDGEEVVYDLTDLTGGDTVRARQVDWNPTEKSISYVLPHPALVSIRIGLGNDGPLLRSLVDWLPRPAGPNREAWDGLDASGYIRLGEHEKREIAVTAFALSDNTILVGNATGVAQFVDLSGADEIARPRSSSRRIRRGNPATQPGDTRSDIGIAIRLVDEAQAGPDGLPQVSGRVPIRLSVAEADRQRTLDRRFEAAFYVDGLKVFENEIGFFPMTWYWDATHTNPGIHYVTANLMGYEGNFGMSTLKLYVSAPPKGEK